MLAVFPFLFEVTVDQIEEVFGVQILTLFDVISEGEHGQVFGQFAALHGLHADLLKGVRKANQVLVVIEFTAEGETSGPGEDARDRIGRSFFARLMLTVVAGDRAVRRFDSMFFRRE